MIKTSNKLETEGNVFDLIKGFYEKSTATIILNGDRLKAFFLTMSALNHFYLTLC